MRYNLFPVMFLLIANTYAYAMQTQRMFFEEGVLFNLMDQTNPQLNFYNWAAGIPKIGHYDAGYELRQNYVLIIFDKKKLPNTLKHFINVDTIAHVYSQIIFHTPVILDNPSDPQPSINNLLFHAFGQVFSTTPYFTTQIPMGVFFPNGITPVDIGKNELKPLWVIVHESTIAHVPAISPNNAQFNITANRAISTFWSIAKSVDNRYASVSYHILINTPNLMDTLRDPLLTSETLHNFISAMYEANSTVANPQDRQAFSNALDTITEIVNGNSLQELSNALTNLTHHLETLSTQLAPVV